MKITFFISALTALGAALPAFVIAIAAAVAVAAIVVVGGVVVLVVIAALVPDREPVTRWLEILAGRHPPAPSSVDGGRP